MCANSGNSHKWTDNTDITNYSSVINIYYGQLYGLIIYTFTVAQLLMIREI